MAALWLFKLDEEAYIDHRVLWRSVRSLHFPLHLDLLAWFSLVSHHQLPESSTNAAFSTNMHPSVSVYRLADDRTHL